MKKKLQDSKIVTIRLEKETLDVLEDLSLKISPVKLTVSDTLRYIINQGINSVKKG
jgi:hypothetical protein